MLRLEFTSTFDMVDCVQVISDHMSRDIGLDDDSTHWVGVAIRECVINAIKHGNKNDSTKRVFVCASGVTCFRLSSCSVRTPRPFICSK